jgi:hypothetical protein
MGYKFTKMMIHDVPYRSILPEKVDALRKDTVNLAMGGKTQVNVSGDRGA